MQKIGTLQFCTMRMGLYSKDCTVPTYSMRYEVGTGNESNVMRLSSLTFFIYIRIYKDIEFVIEIGEQSNSGGKSAKQNGNSGGKYAKQIGNSGGKSAKQNGL